MFKTEPYETAERFELPTQLDMLALLERATAPAMGATYVPKHRAEVPVDAPRVLKLQPVARAYV